LDAFFWQYNHAILIDSLKLEFAGLARSRAAEELLLELLLPMLLLQWLYFRCKI
jgi:hypothetical protein